MEIVTAYDGVISDADLAAVDAAVRQEQLIVMPTDTVYGIASVPFAPAAVERLQGAKGRGEEFPPPVLVADASELDRLMARPGILGMPAPQYDAAHALAKAFWPGPLTIIVKADPALGWNLGRTNGTIAIRQPGEPIALAILKKTGPLAVTSANKHGSAPATNVDAAKAYFWEKVAVYVDAGESESGHPSTIVDLSQSAQPKLIRAGEITPADIAAALA